MLGRKIPRVMCIVAAVGLFPLWVQAQSGARLDLNSRLFTVLCAVRAGAPAAAPRIGPSSVATRVDRALRQLDPQITAPLREFFQAGNFKGTARELGAFISLGLLLDDNPDYAYWLAGGQLPPDVSELSEFRALLKDFYLQAGIESLWNSVSRSYERALERRRAAIAGELLTTRGYLRLIEPPQGQTYTVFLEWLVPPALASARNYGRQYFVVIHPGREDAAESVRHQYLHFLLDSLVAKNDEEMHEFASVSATFVDRIPRLSDQFRRDSLLLVGESLVQAVELRLQGVSGEKAEEELDRREKKGILFVRHFFEGLKGFEEAEPSIRFYLPLLFRGYSHDKEVARFSRMEFAPVETVAAPPAVSTVASDPAAGLVRQANDFLQAGNLAAAQEKFQQVLREVSPEEPRALYGLGLVASREGDRRGAAVYFQKALEHSRNPVILGWANIYLGRIYDLEGVREEAVVFYRAALSTGSGIERIEQAARRGLEHPFGQEEQR